MQKKTMMGMIAAGAVAAALGAVLVLDRGAGHPPPPDFGPDPMPLTLDAVRAQAFGPHYARVSGMAEYLEAGILLRHSALQASLTTITARLADLEAEAGADTFDSWRAEGRLAARSGDWSADDIQGYASGIIAADDMMRDAWLTADRGLLWSGLEPDRSAAIASHAVAVGAWEAYFGERLPPAIAIPAPDLDFTQYFAHAEGVAAAKMAVESLRRQQPDAFPNPEEAWLSTPEVPGP